jgi:CBS domain-containing protein
MPFTAQDLIEDRSEPVSATLDNAVVDALELMIENDFSQLPVIDDENHPKGLITSDGILRGLSNFGVTIEKLSVRDVSERADTYSLDDNIFDLLEGLRLQPAVLIVDGEDRLVGIVTSYDTTVYFRRRAEDIMLVDDIESHLKDHINAAFTDRRSGELDQEALQAAIDEVSNAQAYSGVKQAVTRYLKHLDGHKLKSEWITEACAHLVTTGKELGDLTLYQYTELLLHKSHWSDYKASFSVDDKAIRKLLDGVRDTRNALAHFRNEITRAQREQLRFCLRWLEQNLPNAPEYASRPMASEPPAVSDAGGLVPIDEELDERDSRYAKLALYLQGLSSAEDRVRLSFDEVGEIIGHPLPPSSNHRSWWANDSVSHVQSIQWLDAGWRVASVNMSEGVITFTRSRERELAYIDFFSLLMADFRKKAEFPVRDASPDGTNWINVMALPRVGYQLAGVTFSFARRKRFRVELYLDTGDRDDTKAVFDVLYSQRDEIEREIGTELAWERLNTKRASRIAFYADGSITDSDEDLTRLREWAVDAMIRFQRAIVDRADNALRSLV